MRLKSEHANFIKQAAKDAFGEDVKVYLFGSRVDDRKKGGDIDLYIETTMKKGLYNKKIKMLGSLYKRFGEQKIDVILNNFTSTMYVYKVAKANGILL
ncbi:MAG: nucleotidyltransferase domain-containing protein [Chitinophagaceae bacterium]